MQDDLAVIDPWITQQKSLLKPKGIIHSYGYFTPFLTNKHAVAAAEEILNVRKDITWQRVDSSKEAVIITFVD